MSLLNLKELGYFPITIEVWGDIHDILQGVIKNERQKTPVDALHYTTGFGAASPIGLNSEGESILLNDLCFSTLTNSTEEEYRKTVNNPSFFSGFYTLLPKKSPPSYKTNDTQLAVNFSDFLEILYKKTKTSVAWSAILHCPQIQMMLLKKAPIYKESIFDHKDEYLDSITITTPSWVYMTGILTNKSQPSLMKLNQKQKCIYYENPLDDSANITSHTHGLVLKNKVFTSSQITPDICSLAGHILTTNTEISFIKTLQIYVVGDIKKL